MMNHQEFQEQVNQLLTQVRMELEEIPQPTVYSVVIYRANGSWGLGHVVTHLSLQDWADLHKVKVQEHGASRIALPHEKTDII